MSRSFTSPGMDLTTALAELRLWYDRLHVVEQNEVAANYYAAITEPDFLDQFQGELIDQSEPRRP
jgi:hypothetical protein